MRPPDEQTAAGAAVCEAGAVGCGTRSNDSTEGGFIQGGMSFARLVERATPAELAETLRLHCAYSPAEHLPASLVRRCGVRLLPRAYR